MVSPHKVKVPETWTVADGRIYAKLSEDLTMWVVWKSENQGDAAGFEAGLYDNDDLISTAHWEWQAPDIAEFIQVVTPTDALAALAEVEEDGDKEEEGESSPRRPLWLQVVIALGKGILHVVKGAVWLSVKAIKAFPLVMAVMEELYQEIDDLMTGESQAAAGADRPKRKRAPSITSRRIGATDVG